MAEVIQFPCPACQATLRLPLAMAAFQGPCPRCQQEIVAPDPARGLGAFRPEPKPLPEPAPAPPAGPVTAPEIQEPKPFPAGQTPEAAAQVSSLPCQTSQRTILLLSILLTAVLCLVAGYLIGARSHQPAPSLAPARTLPPPPVVPVVETPAPKVEPTPEPPPPPKETPTPVKASAAAEAALKAFLDAPDWSSRAAHVLAPETTRAAMEANSRMVPDGPTPYQSISIQNSYTDKTTGNTLFIYQVVTTTHPTGIPVAVVETDNGWQVDWQTFVEFRDNQFQDFADGPVDETRRFHLIVSAPPAPRAANTENEHFSSFLLDPPFPGHQQIAYVRKTSEIHATLMAATENGAIFTPVLEVVKRKTPDDKSYLEITNIIAHDWLPEGR